MHIIITMLPNQSVDDNSGSSNSMWRLMCKMNMRIIRGCLKRSLNSPVDIRIVGMIDALYIYSHNIEKSAHLVHMEVLDASLLR